MATGIVSVIVNNIDGKKYKVSSINRRKTIPTLFFGNINTRFESMIWRGTKPFSRSIVVLAEYAGETLSIRDFHNLVVQAMTETEVSKVTLDQLKEATNIDFSVSAGDKLEEYFRNTGIEAIKFTSPKQLFRLFKSVDVIIIR